MRYVLDTPLLIYYKPNMGMKRKDIEKMQADGLISAEQCEKIISHYRLAGNISSRWLFVCLSLLAAILIVGGSGMLLSAHWEYISNTSKALFGAALLLMVWATYFLVRKPLPLLGEGLAVLGAALWGLNILLHAYIFNPGTPEVEGVFLFFLGIVFIPFLTNQRLLVWGVAATSIVLLSMMISRSNPESWLNLPWGEKELYGNILAAFALLGIFWWLIGEKARGSNGILRGYYCLGMCAFLLCLFAVQFPLLYGTNMDDPHFMLNDEGYTLLFAAPVLCLLFKPKNTGWLGWLLMAGATCALVPLVIHISWIENDYQPLAVIGGDDAPSSILLTVNKKVLYSIAIGVGYTVLLLCAGVLSRRISWINYGSVMAIFVIISVLTNIFKSLENSGVALLLSGVLLLVIILLLEWQRRRLVKKIKTQSDTPSEA